MAVGERILVVGPPGSGKTTTAAEIARRTGNPHLEFDALYWRTGSRAVRGTELWSGNRESLWMMFKRDEIVRFAWREYPKYQQRYATLMHDPEWAHLRWVRLRSPGAVRAWVSALGT